MSELQEIHRIEDEAALDRAITQGHVLLSEMVQHRVELDVRIRKLEAEIGQLLAYKALLGVGNRR